MSTATTELVTPPQTKTQYQRIPLTAIRESSTNPREQFNSKRLEELTSSIRQHGVLEPLLVRPATTGKTPGSFEIIAGARRYRAAKAAQNIAEVPAIVMAVTDEEALEIQVIENLQRDDLHPLEEAKGYQALMAAPHRQKPERIAERIGRSVKYIYDRVKLLELIKPVRDVFWNNEITAGHAIQIARLDKAAQELCLKTALFTHEHVLWNPHTDDGEDKTEHRKAISVRELEAWIDEHIRFTPKVQDPLFRLDHPETAKAIEALPKEEKVVPITYDHYVQETARDSKVKTIGPRSWVRADGKAKSKTCEHSELGLVVAGPDRGEAFQICREKHKCHVHYGKEIRSRARVAAGGESDRKKAREREEKRQKAAQAQEQREQRQREHWKAATPAILDALAERVKAMPTKGGGYLADMILKELQQRSWNADKAGKDKRMGAIKTADDVVRAAAYIVLSDEASNSYHGPRTFPKVAKTVGINLEKILKATPVPEPKATQE